MQGIVSHNYPNKVQFEATRMWLNNPSFHALTEAQRYKIKLLQGHMPFGLHAKLSPGTFEYFTILREPVDRVISLNHHILRNPHHPFHEQLTAKKRTYTELMESGLWKAFDNCQVRMLSGDLDVPYGKVTEAHLNKALDNMQKHFPLVGVQNRFDEFVLILTERYGWKFPYYRRFQVAPSRVKKSDLSEEDIKGISERNALDIKLYSIYAERFENDLVRRGEPFQKKLKRYRRRNKIMEKLLNLIPVRKKNWLNAPNA